MAGIVTYDGSVMTAPPLFYSTTGALVNETMTSGDDTLTYSNNTLDEAEIYRIYRPIIAWTDKYVTLLMYIIGFPGNALAFVVWIQRRMRHSSGCYLAALAFVDFVFLSLQLVFELHSVWGVPTLNVFLVCEIFPVFFIASQHLSPLLVLGFTFERFISVCYPFQRDRFCTTSRAIKVSFLYLFNLILSEYKISVTLTFSLLNSVPIFITSDESFRERIECIMCGRSSVH